MHVLKNQRVWVAYQRLFYRSPRCSGERRASISDKSFTFITKTPPAAILLKQAAKLESGSKTPGKSVAGTVTDKQVEDIAKIKLPDLNCYDLETAKSLIRGSARSIGLEVKD